ncbi:heavy metal-associated domain-containing protein [Soonwooa sp.]|uniref:heavy-metal-associated domain-containing protein n=1 Tax=Soonwooa sp. TaxID=1938592 RepID=UPI0026162F83|nr:heavy metal-associated domain-containing protein [Soonwooa sp.]
MKSIIKSGILFLSIFLFSNFSAQSKTETYRVEGNCAMCKDNIETAAKADKNVESATWDRKTKMLTVSYNTEKPNVNAVLKNVAEAGYDNQVYRAADKAYSDLHGCCQYKRPDNSAKMSHECDASKVCELK